MTEDNNQKDAQVIRIVREDKTTPNKPESDIPQHNYRIVDITGKEYDAFGFLLFTSQHVAIMRDSGEGALPILVFGLDKVQYAKILEDQPELPW